MSYGPLIDTIYARLERDIEDGDTAYFNTLLLINEYILKLVTIGVLSCIYNEEERHRYTLEHRLIRADSVGEWVDILDAALTGPASQYFIPESKDAVRHLSERVRRGDIRYKIVEKYDSVARIFGVPSSIGHKVALRHAFRIFVSIRNRTRGHGAVTLRESSEASPILRESLDMLIEQTAIFKLPWAYLHRNLSGKYRVTQLLGDSTKFNYLKRTRENSLANGVYLFLDKPEPTELIISDPDIRDVLLPNGNYKKGKYEVLSYISNDTRRIDASRWERPPGRLPVSETEGLSELGLYGNVFTNLPPMPRGRIPREVLESAVEQELRNNEIHPIVTLTGPGGIGKTTIALAAIERLSRSSKPVYEVILWMSARDIDLLPSGPKTVSPKVIKLEDIAKVAVELLDPGSKYQRGFQAQEYLQDILRDGAAGVTLFVFDNFETLEDPPDVYRWIDTHVRPPNKVLITTRYRDFAGDYPIRIDGMLEEEAIQLINMESKRLGIFDILDNEYKELIIRESDGHPYVIKILLGQVAAERKKVTPARIIAGAEHVLTALFERTYNALSPAAQRVFLLLSSWRVFLPAVAVEAVAIRPGNERFDVQDAIEELRRYSLIEDTDSEYSEEAFIGVPLAASSFGKKKLEVSQYKTVVEEDKKLLMEFGAGKREHTKHGVFPRVENLIKSAASQASRNPKALERFIPILEYIAHRIPKTYLKLAELVVEVRQNNNAIDDAKRYIEKYIETSSTHKRSSAWIRLSELCRMSGDAIGEVHALSEAALLPETSAEEMSDIANQINNRIRTLRGRRVEDAWSPEIRKLIEKVAVAMERHLGEFSATDLSRLAWLYLNIRREDRALIIARKGVEKDTDNEHCKNIIERLE